MNKKLLKFIQNNIIPNFVDVDPTLVFGEYKEIFPDLNILFFQQADMKYILFFADFLDKDLDWITLKLKEVNIKVNRFLPLKSDSNIYVYTNSKKTTPYIYEPVYDDRFVCGRL